ncbi:hypothetical protein DAY19_01775 [Halobacteriovorax vibrionivorans]|uniref:Chorismate-utilising enzyme C-terminal domain-containing protein n=1 Tax=Halobacteriovorax vibrionivorans TaxID=2152716 RepID=A0ABY0ILX2_9BACT|nr:hypothetical protein DAY19_01775 [Halobacteriovorax vibrionivorans]TGD47716.1 hypothetical protein EP118_07140 [Halobacteriovorax sp. Y22]
MVLKTNQVDKSYALFKTESGFLKLEKPVQYFQVTNKSITNVLTNEVQKFDTQAFDELFNKKWQVQILEYELGHLFQWDDLLTQEEVNLATFINFESTSELTTIEDDALSGARITCESFRDEYRNKFKATYENLLDGNCYQLNLTHIIPLEVNDISLLEKSFRYESIFSSLGEFAHLINLPLQDRLILSNSPECLFEYDFIEKKIVTRPIKGTIKKELGRDSLIGDVKNESELNIITDLLRHDLSGIGENFSVVESLREFFEVPGLIHQYSRISVKEDHLNIPKVLKAIFPGGSITGAPKKRVLKLIKEIEAQKRGLYTGSTVLAVDKIAKASINIRSLDVIKSTGAARYGSGGGITLLSEEVSEFDELLAKTNSFLKVFFKDVNF